MKRWLKKALIALCATMLGITAAAFVGCSSCNPGDGGSSSTAESSVGGGNSSTGAGETCEHNWVETVVEATCYAGGYTSKVCSLCNETVTTNQTPKAVCSYEKTTVAATCTEDGYDQFTCKWCADTYKNVTSRATGHDTYGATWTVTETQVDSCTYLHTEKAKCNNCDEVEVFEQEIVKHNFVVYYMENATCATEGVKLYRCDNCGEEGEEETIPVDVNAHDWGSSVNNGNIMTYTCCRNSEHTKTVVYAKDDVEATVSAADLAAAGAVELKNAEMKLDNDALASIGTGDVKLSADTADKEAVTAGMSEADKEKLGDNEIFDFSMTDGDGAPIAFNGKITVTVPYTLSEGEDPANVAIWYIGEDGKPEAIAATYSYSNEQGYVTFETSHFSYYTVVRLSLEERCAMYGHKFETTVVAATCTTQGYTITECVKCHKFERSAFTPALGHSYAKVVTEPTCSAMGYTTYTCSTCGDKYVSDRTAKLAHTYVDSVVAPTCTADGYTLHKCSACGESYSDNPVAATGHSYADGACSVCGRPDPNASTNFYFNLLESLANADTFYLEVKDLKMSMEQTYNNGDKEVTVYEMELARAQLGFDETGIVGKGEGTLVGSMKETGSVNESESYFATAQFLFKNGYIYVYVDGTGLGVEGRSQMIMSAPQSMMTAEMEDEMSMSMEMLMQMAEAYGGDALDIVAGMANVNDNPLNSAIKAVVEYVFTKTETANGYSFELNENRLKDVYDILMTKSVSEIFNLVFGANAYQDTQAWLVASVDKTIPQFEAEVKTELVKWGISLDQVYDYIDSIMFAGMEVPEGEKAPSVRDYIFAEEMANVTLLDIINMAMGEMLEAPLTADAVKEMINTYGEQLGAIKMEDIMGMMGGMGGSASKDSAMAKPMAEKEEEEEAPEIDVEAIIDAYVAFLNKIPVTFTTDKVGTLIDFTISMNNLDIKELAASFGEDMDDEEVPTMSATMRFVLNGSYAAEYDHIVKEAEKLAGANDFEENIFSDELIVCIEDDGTYVWTGAEYYQSNTIGPETYMGQECTKIEVYTRYAYKLDESSKDMITAMSDCHGWWQVSIQAYEIYGVYAYAWVNARGAIIGVELIQDKLGQQYDWTYSIEVYYNPTTGEYSGESQHNYKYVKRVAGEGCTRAYDLYVCTVCGVEEVERDYDTGHDWENRYVLAEGSTDCTDGILCQNYCTKCGRIDHEYTSTYHNYNYEDKLVYTSPKCGPVYVRVGVCPCGKASTVNDRYNWQYQCQLYWDSMDGKYKCAVEGCGFEYSYQSSSRTEYDATAENGYTCMTYYETSYTFPNGVTLKNSSVNYGHNYISSNSEEYNGGWKNTETCGICHKETCIEIYDQYGRPIRYEDTIDGYGWYRVYDSNCNYKEYSLDGKEYGSGTDHAEYTTDEFNSCTQYGQEYVRCEACSFEQSYYKAPDDWWWYGEDGHKYYWNDELELYVCEVCGTQNQNNGDGWVILEDMGDGKIGYFDQREGWWYWWGYELSYNFDNAYVEVIVNYDPDNMETPGTVLDGDLFTKQDTTPIGDYVRKSGILTLDVDAVAEALDNTNVDAETVSVVFWVEMTDKWSDEAYVIGYGLTFTLDELGLA